MTARTLWTTGLDRQRQVVDPTSTGNPRRVATYSEVREAVLNVTKLLLWLILLVLCWPLALLALVLYPFVWLILLPFRLLGVAVSGVLDLLKAILTLPARVLRGPSAG